MAGSRIVGGPLCREAGGVLRLSCPTQRSGAPARPAGRGENDDSLCRAVCPISHIELHGSPGLSSFSPPCRTTIVRKAGEVVGFAFGTHPKPTVDGVERQVCLLHLGFSGKSVLRMVCEQSWDTAVFGVSLVAEVTPKTGWPWALHLG